MSDSKQLTIRPYARLLTMLGEQLIKNEHIALIELIKNSYDADADWVKITFEGFGENFERNDNSKIIIEDNGHGMNQEIIENHWLNPGTPEKKKRKEIESKTAKGRIMQGEKGIGRFAILKLGKKIDIITRATGEQQEHFIEYNFSKYDNDFLTENGKDKELFLDDLKVNLTTQEPKRISDSLIKLGIREKKRSAHGTIIEISDLKGNWNERKIESIYKDLIKLDSKFYKKEKSDFEIFIYKDHEAQNFEEDYNETIELILQEKSVIKIENGRFDSDKSEYRFKMNGVEKIIELSDPNIKALKFPRDNENAGQIFEKRKLECGSFNFSFYIFDLSAQAQAKYYINRNEKEIIRKHRIYLYRDNIRVYPYGDPNDDWLQVDVYRGIVSAGHFPSNDQVIGVIDISQKENEQLKDKTNREGLIHEGSATEDFIAAIQTILVYVHRKFYAQYKHDIKSKKEQDIFKKEQVKKEFDELRLAIEGNSKALDILSNTEKKYKSERKYLVQRVEITEQLAGVGLSVEVASHDMMAMIGKLVISLDSLIKEFMSNDTIDKDVLLKELQAIRGGLSFVQDQAKNMEILFTSSKQRKKSIRLNDIIEKIERIYKRVLKAGGIELSIDVQGSPLIAKTTDAVLLQLLLNLFDNAVYWLKQTSQKDKKIEIVLDGNNGTMIFSDNGPGIDKDDAPYIFEPFYSGKGEEGRGLGLYIARELLERHNYSIEVVVLESDKILSGANFIINFITEDR